MKLGRVLILGAAGRDFHNFNVFFRDNPACAVVAFTAQQIPHISDRRYPPELAGNRYPNGIPIFEEGRLESLISELQVELCVLSYSDLAYADVMHLGSRCNAAGAAFMMLGAQQTMLRSRLPVVAISAVRTGAGKSQVSRAIVRSVHAFLAVENILDTEYDTARTPIRSIGWPRTVRVGARITWQ